MFDGIDVLERLSDHPPFPPTPIDVLRERARSRRSRRMARRGACAVTLTALVVVGLVALRGSPSHKTVISPTPRGRPEVVSGGSGGATLQAPFGLTLSPASGLDAISDVEVGFDKAPVGSVAAAECAAEVVTAAPGAQSTWCASVRPLNAGNAFGLNVTAKISTSHARIDCTRAPGRCVVAARFVGGSPQFDRFAPLAFVPIRPRLTNAVGVVGGMPDPINDGQQITLDGDGFAAGEVVQVEQCRSGAYDHPPDQGPPPAALCDQVRHQTTVAGDDGTVTEPVTIYRDIGKRTAAGVEWQACDPCSLWLLGDVGTQAGLSLFVRPTGSPIHSR